MRFQRWRIGDRITFVSIDAAGRAEAMADSWEVLRAGGGNRSRGLLEVLDTPKAQILPPVSPGKIVCVGLNYRHHAEEMNKTIPESPLIFLKPGGAAIGHGQSIEIPGRSKEVHHEGELAVVIGQRSKHVSDRDMHSAILGYTLMNDVTARDIQRGEGKYTHAKGYDTFAPLGPTVVTDLDPDDLTIEVHVNGELRQSSGCDDMIFKIPELVKFISSIMTLMPGDVISTGTPSGVGAICAGDRVAVSIEGIGRLENPVVDAPLP
jgi:2-keto-4-pentenoate hydratase/2-oxohepta-3-ene-1,7-dioic acid hydratase in catechol pathway